MCLSGRPRRLLPRGRVARQLAPKVASQRAARHTPRRTEVCLVNPAIAALVCSAVHTQSKVFHLEDFCSFPAVEARATAPIQHREGTQFDPRRAHSFSAHSASAPRTFKVRSSSRCATLLRGPRSRSYSTRLCTCRAHTLLICLRSCRPPQKTALRCALLPQQ